MHEAGIAQLLPEVIRETIEPQTPLSALIDVMSAMHAPAEDLLAHVEDWFSAYRTPYRALPLLAHWVDLSRFLSSSSAQPAPGRDAVSDSGIEPGRLRELIASAAELSQWRGTARGMARFLTLATGCRELIINEQVLDEAGQPRPFHLQFRLPATHHHQRTLIAQIIDAEKPAHVTFELMFDSVESSERATVPNGGN